MKGIYSALITVMLFGMAGMALAEQEAPSVSPETGSANTAPGTTDVEGGTAADDQTGTMMQEENNLPDGASDMSTQTGSANTERGDTEARGGSTQSPTADDQPVPEGEQMDPNSGVDSGQDVDPEM